jgi:Tfp pilus assembly protein PilO
MKFHIKNSNYEKYYKDLIPIFKKEKNQRYLFIILSITASIFFIIFAINPTLSTITKLKKQITDSKFVEAQLSEKINNLSILTQEYEQIKPDLPIILDAVPGSPQTPNLVGQIQSLAKQSSVNLTSVKVVSVNLNPQVSTRSSVFNFEVSGKSSYDNLNSFVSNLLKMQRALTISSIQVSKSTANGEIDLALKGQAYFKK